MAKGVWCHWTNVVPFVDDDFNHYVGCAIIENPTGEGDGLWRAYQLRPTTNLSDCVNEAMPLTLHATLSEALAAVQSRIDAGLDIPTLDESLAFIRKDRES